MPIKKNNLNVIISEINYNNSIFNNTLKNKTSKSIYTINDDNLNVSVSGQSIVYFKGNSSFSNCIPYVGYHYSDDIS